LVKVKIVFIFIRLSEIQLGDIIIIKSSLHYGQCLIETSALDGGMNLKIRNIFQNYTFSNEVTIIDSQ
jgi:hypothetical protein